MPLRRTFLQNRVTVIEARIAEYDAAIQNLLSGAIEEYKLDTGQSVTTVRKMNIATLQAAYESALNQLSLYNGMLDQSNVHIGAPSW